MPDKRDVSWMRYAGVGMELLAGLVVGIYAGGWVDKKMAFSKPVMVWLLPLLVLITLLVKLIRDTSKKNDVKRK